MKTILLINPWIYDFAAYDLWIKPWGLLKISSILKKCGFKVNLIDALDDACENAEKRKRFADGTGKFFSETVAKPGILSKIPRIYKKYGITLDTFKTRLPKDDPDFIFVSSGMTYWYPGVFEAIQNLRIFYRKTPIILGGVYASLANEHAKKKSGADIVLKNSELDQISSIIGAKCDFSSTNILNEHIDYSWYTDAKYGVLRVSMGCPFDCSYCAQKKLSKDFILKQFEKAMEEITVLSKMGIKNFAFYDDALLFSEDYIVEYFSRVKSLDGKFFFFTPNGLHARFLSWKIAHLMKQVNFLNPILSLEIADDKKSKDFHKKITNKELTIAVDNLRKAGYKEGEYTVYLMLGIPGISIQDVNNGIDFVHSLGGRISLSEFSPVPGTVLSERFPETNEEPLLQNNSVFPSYSVEQWREVQKIKNKAVELNHKLAASD